MTVKNRPLIIITGASSGIGAEIARQFSQAGFSLGLLARNLQALEDLNLPNTLCIKADVTDPIAFKNTVIHAEEKFGSVNGLINNAGCAKGDEFTSLTHADQDAMVQVNLLGVINGIEAVLVRFKFHQRLSPHHND